MRLRDGILLLAVLVALLASVLLLVVGLQQRKIALDKSSHEICVAIRNIDVIVTQQLQRSKQNLPKLAYFQEHPADLERQIESINRQLTAFRPRTCR